MAVFLTDQAMDGTSKSPSCYFLYKKIEACKTLTGIKQGNNRESTGT